jgi:hypothetical protein
MNALLGFDLPEPIQFLGWGWWIIHVVATAAVFLFGMAVGKKSASRPQ